LSGLAACSGLADVDATIRRFEFGPPFGPGVPAPATRPADPPALTFVMPPSSPLGPPKLAEPPAEVMDIPVPDPPAPDVAPTVAPPSRQPPAPPPAPHADPGRRRAALINANPWLTRFWAELTPDQQGRVRRAFVRRSMTSAPEALWDPLGLTDRVRLVFGEG